MFYLIGLKLGKDKVKTPTRQTKLTERERVELSFSLTFSEVAEASSATCKKVKKKISLKYIQ